MGIDIEFDLDVMIDVEVMKDELDGFVLDEEFVEVVDVVDDWYMVMVWVKVVLSVVVGLVVLFRVWEVLVVEDGVDVWLVEEDFVELLGELEVCKVVIMFVENVVVDGIDCDVRDVVVMMFVDDDIEEMIGEEMINEFWFLEVEIVVEEMVIEEFRVLDMLIFFEEVVIFVLVGLFLLIVLKRFVWVLFMNLYVLLFISGLWLVVV